MFRGFDGTVRFYQPHLSHGRSKFQGRNEGMRRVCDCGGPGRREYKELNALIYHNIEQRSNSSIVAEWAGPHWKNVDRYDIDQIVDHIVQGEEHSTAYGGMDMQPITIPLSQLLAKLTISFASNGKVGTKAGIVLYELGGLKIEKGEIVNDDYQQWRNIQKQTCLRRTEAEEKQEE